MKPASKNLTPSGISRKKTNNFTSLRLYLIFGSLAIFAAFAIYTQILIQNAKREQEYVPRIFAKYIAYTDSYLRQAERFASFLGEITSQRFESLLMPNFQEAISDYMLTEFPNKNPIPVIITDADMVPQLWNQVGVAPDSTFDSLSEDSRKLLRQKMRDMNRTGLVADGAIIGYVHIARPISLQEFIKDIDYAVVVTDIHKQPRYWHNMGITETETWETMLPYERAVLTKKLDNMTEVPLSDKRDNLGYIYFTTPKSLSQIRILVILALGLALMLIAFGSYGLFLLHRTEKDTLWIGLAKETAHQFGTPITSLMGWIDLLRESPSDGTPRADMPKIIEYMTTDLQQLRIIASRFGKVGSQTKLKSVELHSVLQETADYFSSRLPHLGSRIDLHLISKTQGLNVLLDTDLFKWTLENLIKNCIDAMSQKGGNIVITATHNDKYIYVHVRDEGKGIPHSQWKKVFEPGITTKTRGWGLGLSLAKRIIEEYHHGHIKVLESTPGEGTTFEIKLPFQHNPQE